MKQPLLSALCATAVLSFLTSTSQAQSLSGTGTSTGTLSTGTLSTGTLSTGTTKTGVLGGSGVGNGHHGLGAVGPEQRAREIIARYDKDGDHALNVAELTAFFEAVRQRAAERGTQQASNTTSGQPAHGTPQEHAARAIEKFDRNGDGKLEAGELAALLIAFREHALQHGGQGLAQGQGRLQGLGQNNHNAPATTIPSSPNN